jgi:hypothetical protein
MGANGVEPLRLALRYDPPGIIVEYVYHCAAARQLYHHVIDLKAELSSLGTSRFSVRTPRSYLVGLKLRYSFTVLG